MNEYEYRIQKLHRMFDEYSDKKIALYGTGASVNMILDEFPDLEIMGLMDSNREGTYVRGRYVMSENEAILLGVEVLVIPARFDSAAAVFKRMLEFCTTHGIVMLDIYGNDMTHIFRCITEHLRGYASMNSDDLWRSIMSHDSISISMRDAVCYGEKTNLRPRNPVIDILNRAVDNNKKVIIYADFNIKENYCRELLNGWGIAEEYSLVLYNNDSQSIYDGLFHKIKELSYGSLLHIGCDPVKDGYVPLAYGTDCFLIKKNAELMRDAVPELFSEVPFDDNGIDLDIFSDPFCVYESDSRLFPYPSDAFKDRIMGLIKERNDIPEDFVYSKKAKKSILVTFTRIPQYDTYGGDRTAYNYLKVYAKMGLDVVFIPLDFMDNDTYTGHLKELGIHILTGDFYKKHWLHWLIVNGHAIDHVFMQLMESKLICEAVKAYCPGAKIAYCEHDLVFIRKQREYELSGDPMLNKESEKYKKTDLRIMSNADIVYTLGAYERDIIKNILPDKAVKDLPVYIYDEVNTYIERDFSLCKDLLIVAHVDFEQNLDGILWFKNEIYPKIVSKYPDIVWHIVGKVSDVNRSRIEGDNIILHGWMSDDDLRPLYESSRIEIVPLRFGSGVKGKIIEAAYHGLPVITTTVGAEGIPLDNGNILVADGARNFADTVIDLYEDIERLALMSAGSKKFIRSNYTSDVAERIFRGDFICDG